MNVIAPGKVSFFVLLTFHELFLDDGAAVLLFASGRRVYLMRFYMHSTNLIGFTICVIRMNLNLKYSHLDGLCL